MEETSKKVSRHFKIFFKMENLPKNIRVGGVKKEGPGQYPRHPFELPIPTCHDMIRVLLVLN